MGIERLMQRMLQELPRGKEVHGGAGWETRKPTPTHLVLVLVHRLGLLRLLGHGHGEGLFQQRLLVLVHVRGHGRRAARVRLHRRRLPAALSCQGWDKHNRHDHMGSEHTIRISHTIPVPCPPSPSMQGPLTVPGPPPRPPS
jgi:hypothetical protein